MWTVEYLDIRVKAELDGQPGDIRSRFERIVRLIRTNGLERVHEPYVKHLQGPLWEMRMKGKDGIARAIYVTAKGRKVMILRVFTKKTERTPRREIELAMKRARELQ